MTSSVKAVSGSDGAVRQPGLKQVESRHPGSDGEEGDQQLQEPGHDDSPARLQVAAGAQGPLHDELVGSPIEAMQGHQPRQHAGPGQLRVAGGQIEMHLAGPLPVQRHHGIPAANLSEGQYGQEYPGPQQQDRLNHVRPDDGLQPAPDGVAGRDCRQSDHEEGVIEGVHIELGASGLGWFPDGGGTVSFGGEGRTGRSMGFRVRCHRDPADGVTAQQDADRARADVERRHHLDDGHQDHHDERIGEAAALVVAGPQVVGEGVDLQPPEDGQEPVAEQHQSHDGPELEVGLGETHAEPDPHHPHHVVGADVAAENRAGHSPPGGVAAGQKEVLRGLLSAAGPETDGQHGH